MQSESFSEKLGVEQRIPESNKPETIKKSSKLYRLDPFWMMMALYESAAVFDPELPPRKRLVEKNDKTTVVF